MVLFPILSLVLLGAGGLPTAAPAEFAPVQSGHSAMWYNPARDGEGWVLEVLPDDKALLYWFTYDEDGDQRWLQGVGDIVRGATGDVIDFPELYVTRGAEFGSGFDPDDVQIEVVGEATLTFSGCDHGMFSYAAFGQSQTITIERLSQTMAAGCEPINGVPGQPVKAYAGQSGSWFDLSHDGEGYALQWLSRDEALLTWYTYDREGNQYWLIGVGQYEDGEIVFPNLQSTRGARFGAAFDPEDVAFIDWGSLTMELDCNAGAARYESELAAFGAGDFELTRLTKLQRPDCPYLAPKLWDLYDITWNEIPIEPGNVTESDNVQADAIADDGTVAARGPGPNGEDGWHLRIWRPEMGEWKSVTKEISGQLLFISADGNAVVSSEPVNGPGRRKDALIWREDTGWEPLGGLIFERSVVYGASQDLSQVVGSGRQANEARAFPWIWSAETGQEQLPLNKELPPPIPGSVSNDGSTITGVTRRPPPEGSTFPRNAAVIWRSGREPKIMRNDEGAELSTPTSCNHDCSIVFGFGQVESDPSRPETFQAWFWKRFGGFGYLGAVPDAIDSSMPYVVADVSADGTLAVGSYSVGAGSSRGYIWTQRTGMASVRGIVDEMGIGDDSWKTQIAISVSSSGKKILLRGYAPNAAGPEIWRAVVLDLHPKQ